MDTKKLLEERLREAACFGDLELLEELINKGVDVNARNEVNGWTALHWAAHRNLPHIVKCLLSYGADKNCFTHKGETPYNLSTNRNIQILLEGVITEKEPTKLPITPSYLKYPSLSNITSTQNIDRIENFPNHLQSNFDQELVLKLRIADVEEQDFIEVELQKTEMTYEKLIEVCCRELNISSSAITKVRKLPNTIIRNDKDVQRLKDFQEIEIILSKPSQSKSVPCSISNQSPIVNGNQYESISLKKHQTILY